MAGYFADFSFVKIQPFSVHLGFFFRPHWFAFFPWGMPPYIPQANVAISSRGFDVPSSCFITSLYFFFFPFVAYLLIGPENLRFSYTTSP